MDSKTIEVLCASGHPSTASAEWAGQNVICPVCGEELTLPGQPKRYVFDLFLFLLTFGIVGACICAGASLMIFNETRATAERFANNGGPLCDLCGRPAAGEWRGSRGGVRCWKHVDSTASPLIVHGWVVAISGLLTIMTLGPAVIYGRMLLFKGPNATFADIKNQNNSSGNTIRLR